jgi:D-erythrulose 4-kinase
VTEQSGPGTEASQRAARIAVVALGSMARVIREAEPELARMDAIAGDGDHGRGMVKGVTAALDAARATADDAGVATVLKAAGEAWGANAGGTSGVLWGQFLTAVGARLSDDAESLKGADVAAAVRSGVETMQRLGKAELGDKTMIDALLPFTDELQRRVASGTSLVEAWTRRGDGHRRGGRDGVTAAEARAGATVGREECRHPRSRRHLAGDVRSRRRRGPRGVP